MIFIVTFNLLVLVSLEDKLSESTQQMSPDLKEATLELAVLSLPISPGMVGGNIVGAASGGEGITGSFTVFNSVVS